MEMLELIAINQVLQGVKEDAAYLREFNALDQGKQREIIDTLEVLIGQAKPASSDGVDAVSLSGLSPRVTPCVMVKNGYSGPVLRRVSALPQEEYKNIIRLYIAMYRVADGRRRALEGGPCRQHWWHRDLGNADVVAEIIAQYEAGKLA
jgi:hypothetical protein